ncbi:DNA internalization-related competence protein ComEC/Rec2 [Levilactobacillus spicheri]
MRRYSFFVVLPLAAVSVMLGGHFWGGSVLLGVTLGRLVALRHWRVVVLGLILALGFGGWLVSRQRRLTNRRLSVTQVTPQTVRLRVAPDSVSIRGTGYHLVGQRADGERLLVHGQLRSVAELRTLQRLTVPTEWVVTGAAQGLLPAPNQHQFDAARYWEHRGIVNTLRVTGPLHLRPVASDARHWWGDHWHGWRSRLIQRCQRLPGALKVYALGLFPGSRATEAAQELAGMQRLGLIHLFAISGLHVALLLTVLEWSAVHLHLSREWWDWGLLLLLLGYAVLAGGGSGVLRACWMRAVQLGARRTGHSVDGLTAWSVALGVGLWQNPGLLFELGSQLSYGLSLGLILLPPLSVGWRQLSLTLLSLPSLLTGIFQWHGLTILANAVVVPLFPLVILPVTVVGTTVGPVFPGIARACAAVLGTFDAGLTGLASLPGNVLFGRPAWWISWAWLAGTWWLLSRPSRERRRGVKWLVASYVVVFGVIHLPLTGEVTYFDVGQGDSILIREPLNRRVTLIDVGGRLAFPQPHWAPPQAVQYGATHTSINYLKSLGIDHVDDVYLTHHDADHIGDLPAILQNLRVRRLLVPAGMEREPGWQRLLRGAPRVTIQPLQVGMAAGLRVWHPFRPGVADNGGSLALQGWYGGLNFWFMGDLDQAGERQILATGLPIHADVLKVGHHGSKTATAPAFVRQLRPRLAIISAGRHNRYGHPDQETLATLRQQRVPYWSTQENGMIRYTYWGQRGSWSTKLHLREASST